MLAIAQFFPCIWGEKIKEDNGVCCDPLIIIDDRMPASYSPNEKVLESCLNRPKAMIRRHIDREGQILSRMCTMELGIRGKLNLTIAKAYDRLVNESICSLACQAVSKPSIFLFIENDKVSLRFRE